MEAHKVLSSTPKDVASLLATGSRGRFEMSQRVAPVLPRPKFAIPRSRLGLQRLCHTSVS